MKKTVLAIICCIVISACQPTVPSAAWCRVTEAEQPTSVFQQDAQSAACIIKFNNELLVLQTNTEQYKLAISQATSDESLACIAHRGIWQSYGFNVQVGAELGHHRGTRYFDCTAPINTLPDKRPYRAPRWGTAAEHKVTTIVPDELSSEQWLTNLDTASLQKMFKAASINR